MKNNNDYIYNLVFKNKEGKDIIIIPLLFDTDIDFQMPEDTLWIEIKINRLNENKQYERYILCSLITKDVLENRFNKTKDGYYIVTSKFKYYPGFSDRSLKIFNTNDELQAYIKSLIQFFHEHPYGQTNKEEDNRDNLFSKKLIKMLNKKLYIKVIEW